jgi:hypothetical protein
MRRQVDGPRRQPSAAAVPGLSTRSRRPGFQIGKQQRAADFRWPLLHTTDYLPQNEQSHRKRKSRAAAQAHAVRRAWTCRGSGVDSGQQGGGVTIFSFFSFEVFMGGQGTDDLCWTLAAVDARTHQSSG